jgi:hypothetical protein
MPEKFTSSRSRSPVTCIAPANLPANARYVEHALLRRILRRNRSESKAAAIAGRYEEIAEARYFPNVERPEAFNRNMTGWRQAAWRYPAVP